MRRTIVIGDVHGCLAELEELLDAVGLNRDDRLVFVGDLVVRGPDPRGVMALARRLGASAVRGNHEDKLLRHRASVRAREPLAIGSMTQATAAALGADDFGWLAQLPYWLRLEQHDALVVHAGMLPGVPIELQRPHVLTNLRGLDELGLPIFARTDRLWAASYPAPEQPDAPHVIFGHNAEQGVQIHARATGLDTGCVYGGQLTAMVLAEDQPVPPPDHRRDVLVQVAARQAWVPIT